jgi:hypothetical protein
MLVQSGRARVRRGLDGGWNVRMLCDVEGRRNEANNTATQYPFMVDARYVCFLNVDPR